MIDGTANPPAPATTIAPPVAATNETASAAETVGMAGVSRADIARLHAFERGPMRKLLPMIAALVALAAAAAAAWWSGYWPLLALIWPAQGYVIFVLVLAFHDASHGRLHPVGWINDGLAHITGTLSFVPLAVYRHAHARHHAYLGTERDPELWPFNTPGTSRTLRVSAAVLEIVFGIVYSPLLFLRSVLIGPLSRTERAAILRGYAACALALAVNLAAANHFGTWDLFLVVAVVPAAIAGMLQTLNKYMQHLGLHGRTVLGLTRTVLDRRRAGELVSATMYHNDHHGTHHRYAKIPYYHLPPATPYTLSQSREACPVFPSVASAVADMLPCLADPKVGPQWNDARG
jgi:fatty acid desaturase